jgi:hypothetical protein
MADATVRGRPRPALRRERRPYEEHHHDSAKPCEAWGRKARLGDATWEGPALAQVAGMALDDVTMASVVAALGSTQQPVAIDRARIDRQIRELALEHAAACWATTPI